MVEGTNEEASFLPACRAAHVNTSGRDIDMMHSLFRLHYRFYLLATWVLIRGSDSKACVVDC